MPFHRMPFHRKKLNLPPLIASTLIAVAVALVGAGEWCALLARERRDYPVQILDVAYCTKCHPDSYMQNRMRLKEGSCRFIYHDGKPGLHLDLAGIAPPGSALGHRRHPAVATAGAERR
jgi:hypothetical protein